MARSLMRGLFLGLLAFGRIRRFALGHIRFFAWERFLPWRAVGLNPRGLVRLGRRTVALAIRLGRLAPLAPCRGWTVARRRWPHLHRLVADRRARHARHHLL